MRIISLLACVVFGSGTAALSQAEPQTRPTLPPTSDAASAEKAAELRRAIEQGQAEQRAVDERNTRIWRRWDFAVCIGCGPMPKGFRIVYTTPGRVLAGFTAADDDDRQRGMRF